ncbi:MAG: hypothetical protein AAFU60_03345 [Bacteroidota bacterium]
MEDNYDKLDEFFRKQLQSEVRSEPDWDRPDALIWEQAQQHLAITPEQKKRRGLVWLWWLAGGLLLGGTLFYIAHLLNVNQSLQQELIRKEQIAIVTQQQTQERIIQYQEQIIRLEDEIINVKNTYKQELSTFSTQYEQQLTTLKQDLLQAQASIENLNIQAKDFTPNPMLEDPMLASANNAWALLHGLPTRQTPLLPAQNPKVHPEVIILQNNTKSKKGNRSGWEIGIAYGRPLGTFNYAAEWKEGERGEELRLDRSVRSYQLHLGYSLSSNWWVVAGARMTQYRGAASFALSSQYDKDREYTKPNGKRANDLNLQTTNDYVDSDWRVIVENGDEFNLEDEDMLSGSFTHTQSYQLWQFPLKVEYRKRNNQWGWQLHAGALGNYLQVFEESLEGRVMAREKEVFIELEQGEVVKDQKFYWGLEAGLGASYQLRKRLLVRGDLMCQYDFAQWRPVAQLGLGYQF